MLTLVVNLTSWLVPVILDAFTKYEVSIFNRSVDIKGIKNLKLHHVT